MRSIGKKLVPAICAIAFMVAIPATAQAQVAVTGVAGVFGLTGDDFDGTDAGFGVEGGLSTRLGESFSLGGVFHWSSHGITDTDESLDNIQILAQPLIHFGEAGSTDFFVGARGGYGSIGDDVDTTDDPSGLVIGPVAGVGFPLGTSATFGVGGTYTFLALSDDVSGGSWGAGAFLSLVLGG